MLKESHNTLQHQLYTFLKLKTKNFNTFIRFDILLSGDIQVNPGPDSNLCDSCGKRVNKRCFCCIKCNVKMQKHEDICKMDFAINVKYLLLSIETFRHYPKTYHSITSSNIKTRKQTFPENHPEWKVIKNKSLHFGHLNINSLLPKIEQLRPLLIN